MKNRQYGLFRGYRVLVFEAKQADLVHIISLDSRVIPEDFFVQKFSQIQPEPGEGLVANEENNWVFDTVGRLPAEQFAEMKFGGGEYAWYKGHRLWVGSNNLKYGHYSVQYKIPEGEEIPDKLDWFPTARKPRVGRSFYGELPASEAQNLTFEAEQIWKMAFYKGFWTLVESRQDDWYTVRIAIPYREMAEELDWFKKFDDGYGTIPVSDPDLYIDDLGIIREDLLTKTFPVNWRDSTYKGFPIKVGAHSDTHHFATHHADVLLPRGVLPAFLQPAIGNPPGSGPSAAIQTGPQDFMAKIAIDDSELRFV